jgi:hypothetical protein
MVLLANALSFSLKHSSGFAPNTSGSHSWGWTQAGPLATANKKPLSALKLSVLGGQRSEFNSCDSFLASEAFKGIVSKLMFIPHQAQGMAPTILVSAF